MSDLLRLLDKKRSAMMQKVTDDDVKRAVKKLSVLGEGFQLIEMEERTMVRRADPRYGVVLAADRL